MSSPPPPPSNPLKRPSISSASSQPLGTNPKRPRMHPLRQTSFPNTIDTADGSFSFGGGGGSSSRGFGAASDAGSVTGSFTGSLGGLSSADGVFGAAARNSKKRGRKSKADKERDRGGDDTGSVRGGYDTGSVKAGGGGDGDGRGGGGGGDEDDDEFDDEGGELLGREEGTTDTEAEKKNLALLVDAFNPLQSERYDLFKRAKLRKETLRRIVNHALSQSVPASVVTTINGFTKVFAGEMIEKARTVQLEWADAFDQAALARLRREKQLAKTTVDSKNNATPSLPGSTAQTPTASMSMSVKHEPVENSQSRPLSRTSGTPDVPKRDDQQLHPPGGQDIDIDMDIKLPPNPHRGQLLPSHLREALRRYKRDGEGGGVGFSGLSMGNLGVRGSATWSAGSVGGRRIFR